MKVKIYNPWAWILTGAIGMALLVLWVLGFADLIHHPEILNSDAPGYLEAGKWLYEGKIHPFRTPGYPFFTGIPFMLGLNEDAARVCLIVFQFGFWLGTAYVLLHWVKSITQNVNYGIIAGLVFLSLPGTAVANITTLSEPLSILLSVLSYYCLYLFWQKGAFKYLNLFFYLAFFNAAVRPGNLYPALAAFALLFLFVLLKKVPWRQLLVPAGSMALFYLLPVGTMKSQYGQWRYTFNDNYMVYHYVGSYAASIPQSTQIAMYDSFMRADKQFVKDSGTGSNRVDWLARDAYYKSEISKIIRERKKQLVVAWIQDMKENATTGNPQLMLLKKLKPGNRYAGILYSLSKWENVLFTLGLFLLTGFAVLLWFRNRFRADGVGWMGLFIAGHCVFTVAVSALSFWQGDRFHIVFYPLVIVLFFLLLFRGMKGHRPSNP
ncbi:MAG: hypothetical protein JNL57_13395 [Bacteroidetes bacterium]|nr:hypothetical protein [Bacteroidota bacterium]